MDQLLSANEVRNINREATRATFMAFEHKCKLSVDLLSRDFYLMDALCESGLVQNKSVARRVIAIGYVYVNNCRVVDISTILTSEDLIEGGRFDWPIILLSVGSKYFAVLSFFEPNPMTDLTCTGCSWAGVVPSSDLEEGVLFVGTPRCPDCGGCLETYDE